mgnify:CR=1 FL=1
MSTEDTPKSSRSNRNSYMQDYYKKNKDHILNQRSRRYKSDKDFRDRINLSRRKTRYLNNHDEKVQSVDYLKEIEVNVAKTKMRVIHPTDRTKSAVVNMYTLGDTALALGVDKNKLDNWLYRKALPQPIYRNKSNWRLYTEDQVQIMQQQFLTHKKQARKNNYTFRLTEDLQKIIKDKFSNLVGGINETNYEEGLS